MTPASANSHTSSLRVLCQIGFHHGFIWHARQRASCFVCLCACVHVGTGEGTTHDDILHTILGVSIVPSNITVTLPARSQVPSFHRPRPHSTIMVTYQAAAIVVQKSPPLPFTPKVHAKLLLLLYSNHHPCGWHTKPEFTHGWVGLLDILAR